MSLWTWIVLGCVAAWAIKFAGYLVPVRWLESPRMSRVAGCLTIGLLASLTTMNTDSELIVIGAAGASRMTVIRPMLILAVATSLVCLAITSYVNPPARQKMRALLASYGG